MLRRSRGGRVADSSKARSAAWRGALGAQSGERDFAPRGGGGGAGGWEVGSRRGQRGLRPRVVGEGEVGLGARHLVEETDGTRELTTSHRLSGRGEEPLRVDGEPRLLTRRGLVAGLARRAEEGADRE